MSAALPERPGRPRNPDLDLAILEASLDEVAELGYHAASMTGIARRASVPKSTIYRRWESKQDLVLDAMRSLIESPAPAPTRPALEALHEIMDNLAHQWQDRRAAAVTAALFTESRHNADLHRVWQERRVDPFRERVRAVVRRGIQSGELRQDTDAELLAEMILSIPLHMSMRPMPADVSDLAERFMRVLVEGVRAPSTGAPDLGGERISTQSTGPDSASRRAVSPVDRLATRAS